MADTRTKIVCTIGPASRGHLPALMRAGLSAARLNFSHGTHADHAELFALVRDAAARLGKHVPIVADLQGPKIRLGVLPESGVTLQSLSARTPEPPALRAAYEAIGLERVGLQAGPANLCAVFATPRGRVALESKGL